MVPIEVMIHLACSALPSKVFNPSEWIYIEALKEKRQNAEDKWLSYRNQISKVYNERLRSRTLNVGTIRNYGLEAEKYPTLKVRLQKLST